MLNIDSYTLTNENFRTTLWTGGNLQLTVMAIPVGGEVGLEQHHGIDQFLRIEQGKARVLMGDSLARLENVREAPRASRRSNPTPSMRRRSIPTGRCIAPPRKPQPRKPSTGIETGVSVLPTTAETLAKAGEQAYDLFPRSSIALLPKRPWTASSTPVA